MFSSCPSLQSVPLLDTSSVTSMASMFNNCPSLKSVELDNVKVSLSVSGCMLSTTAIVTIFNSIETATGQTITVSNNWGYSALTTTDRGIAANKGWTIA